jgi:hypothetical protein
MHSILVLKTSSPWWNDGYSLIGGATQFLVTHSTHALDTSAYGKIITPVSSPYTFDTILDNQVS